MKIGALKQWCLSSIEIRFRPKNKTLYRGEDLTPAELRTYSSSWMNASDKDCSGEVFEKSKGVCEDITEGGKSVNESKPSSWGFFYQGEEGWHLAHLLLCKCAHSTAENARDQRAGKSNWTYWDKHGSIC
jgi:hypothetical protein